MSERNPQTAGAGSPKRTTAKPGRKRMGREVFVPVTMKVEPPEFATIEAVAKAGTS